MRIYVDFDDVLCETAQALTVLAQELFGRDVPFEQIHTFDLRTAFRLDHRQYEALMDRAHAPAFLLPLPPVAGCVTGLQAWLRQGHEVVVVTGRPSTTHRVSRDWLCMHGLASLPVLYVDKYSRNHPAPPDAPPFLSLAALLQEPFDVVIDDSPVVLDALQTRPAGCTVVFDRPWNRTYVCHAPRVTRCRGWREVMAHAERASRDD
jgi:hypothetical protein